MSNFLEALEQTPLLADGATGSYLFELTGRLSEANHLYEALNRDRPELIREVHFAYLQAGARCLTTNTFGANRTYLDPLGEGDHVAALNRLGVEAVKESIAAFSAQHAEHGPHYILGSVGPTRDGHESPNELKAIYREQIGALLQAGVDALLLETHTSLAHVMVLLGLLEEYPERPPVIVQMAIKQTQEAGGWSQDPHVLVKTAADLGAQMVGVNCCSPWEADAFLDEIAAEPVVKEKRVRLAVTPNGGGFHRIGHRYMSSVNPEFMGKLARAYAERGVGLMGGCCEVHPAHISEMHNYLQASQGPRRAIERVSFEAKPPAGPQQKRGNGLFSQKLMDGQFAVSVEMLPPRNTRPRLLQSQVEFVGELAASGLADALDITDGSRGIPLMPPGDFVSVVRERLDWDGEDRLEFIPHFTTRDLNTMGLQSRLIGYYARRIHNVLIITGDPPKMSPTYPRSTAVFDMDSVALINYVHRCLNAGVDFGGRSLGKQKEPRTHFTIGTGFEPEAVDLQAEQEKLERKIDGGADYLMTQPAFRFGPLEALAPYRDRVKALVGVLVLTSLEHARRFDQVPGVSVPEEVFGRLGRYEQVADQAKAGRELAAEQIRWIRTNGWAGLYLMSPASHGPLLEVLRAGAK